MNGTSRRATLRMVDCSSEAFTWASSRGARSRTARPSAMPERVLYCIQVCVARSMPRPPAGVKLESYLAWKYECGLARTAAGVPDADLGRFRQRAGDPPPVARRRRLPGAEGGHPGERLPAG